MHHKHRVFAAMALAAHARLRGPSSSIPSAGDTLPPHGAEVALSVSRPRRGRAGLSLVAIVGLNAAMLVGFVASTGVASDREMPLTGRAAAPGGASCGCVS